MQTYNILIGCDQLYYDEWGETLLKSIRHFNPWVNLHAHIVNPCNLKKLPYVDYTTKTINFPNDTAKIGYLQSCRFLAVADKFKDEDLVMTIDADSICTKEFSEDSFRLITNSVTVLKHPKDDRWLAGLVTYGTENFKKDYAKLLNELPLQDWAPFHDQTVLAHLSTLYQFTSQESWMSIGKNGKNNNQRVFLTLKGNQKYKEKYLQIYNNVNKQVN